MEAVGGAVGRRPAIRLSLTVHWLCNRRRDAGTITGLPQERFASTAVVLIGPTFNKLQADVEQSGAFEFPAVVPGVYRLSLSGVPEVAPITIVVDSFRTFEVPVVVPSR